MERTKKEVIYCAGPFSGATREEQELNVAKAIKQALKVREEGFVPLLPHVAILPGCTYEQAMDECFELMDRSDAVLMLERWETSPGALREKVFAHEQGLPVFMTLDALKAEHGEVAR